MAFAIGAAAASSAFSVEMESTTGDTVIKRTLIDGAIDDTHILQIAEDLDNVSNARMLAPKFNGRLITGQKGAAVAALQNLISTYMVLTFGRVDAISGLSVTKNWIVPAYVNVLAVGSPPAPNVGTPGTGSLDARLGRLIANLETYLVGRQADNTFVAGGWTYLSGGFGTANDVIDGE